MKDDLPFLIQLQSHDSVLIELEEKAASFDPLIQAQNKKIKDLQERLKATKGQLTQLQLKKKNLENDVKAKEDLMKKHQAELNSLKSNDAYKAMLGEIEAAKKAVSDIEEQILIVMEEMDQAQADAKKNEETIKTEETAVKAEVKKLEDEKKSWLQKLDEKKKEREAYAATVPADLKSQYEMIRKRAGGVAIVPLQDTACGGCRMFIPPNRVSEVRVAKNIVICDSCSRILYFPQTEEKNKSTEVTS